MNKLIDIKIDVPPKGKASVRVSGPHAWIPAPTKAIMDRIGWEVKAAYPGFAPISGPRGIRLELDAYYRVPTVFEGIRVNSVIRQKMLSDEIRPVIKPDYDNVFKIIGDSWNGIVWPDDCRIVEAEFKSWFRESGSMTIRVFAL
jgi:Holliday junction resolvase RusA-like endonuclease